MVRAATVHLHPIRPAIHALKYQDHPELAANLVRYLVATLLQPPWPGILPSLDGVVAVPLHPERLEARGYNQANLLAVALARRIGLPVLPEVVVRVRATQTQVGLTARERVVNVRGAFEATAPLAGKSLLLVDDVYTTGATMTACAEALGAAGAHHVYGLALAMPDLPANQEDAPILDA